MQKKSNLKVTVYKGVNCLKCHIQMQATASALLNKILLCSQIMKGTLDKFRNIVTWRLRTGVERPEETIVDTHLFGKHSPERLSNKNDCAGEDQLQITRPRHTGENWNLAHSVVSRQHGSREISIVRRRYQAKYWRSSRLRRRSMCCRYLQIVYISERVIVSL